MLWFCLAGFVLTRGTDKSRLLLASALLPFGISDLVETRTGAWYSPWWLLVWKAICVLLIAGAGLRLYRTHRRFRKTTVPERRGY
jgi:hypothetical protein